MEDLLSFTLLGLHLIPLLLVRLLHNILILISRHQVPLLFHKDQDLIMPNLTILLCNTSLPSHLVSITFLLNTLLTTTHLTCPQPPPIQQNHSFLYLPQNKLKFLNLRSPHLYLMQIKMTEWRLRTVVFLVHQLSLGKESLSRILQPVLVKQRRGKL